MCEGAFVVRGACEAHVRDVHPIFAAAVRGAAWGIVGDTEGSMSVFVGAGHAAAAAYKAKQAAAGQAVTSMSTELPSIDENVELVEPGAIVESIVVHDCSDATGALEWPQTLVHASVRRCHF